MNKTFFKIDECLSIIVLSLISVIFVLVNSYSSISNILGFLFMVVKLLVFVGVPFIIYICEKDNFNFKKVAGIYVSYYIINFGVMLMTSVSIVNNSVSWIWEILVSLVNLVILLSSLLILIEQILKYKGMESKVYNEIVMKVVYMVGNIISYPFINFINMKSKKNDDF